MKRSELIECKNQGCVKGFIKTKPEEYSFGHSYPCHNCKCSGFEPVIEDIRIDVPDGYKFSGGINRGLAWFVRHSPICYISFKLPSKPGQVEPVVCDVCGGNSGLTGKSSFTGEKVIFTCSTCKGKPLNLKTTIKVEKDSEGYFFRERKEVV